MKTIDIVYFNAGGGHRSAAQALQRVIREQERPWTVRTLDLFEVLDPKGRFESLTGMRPEAFYNLRLARGWTLGMSQELRLLQGLIRVASPAMRRVLERHWRENPPDLVVSVVPNFNRVMHDALHSVRPGTPCVTILTDLADHPPRFWIERGQRQYVVCGTPRAAAQARDAGVPDSRVFETSGMVLRPDFYRAALSGWSRTGSPGWCCSAATDRARCCRSRGAWPIRNSSWSAATTPSSPTRSGVCRRAHRAASSGTPTESRN
jgi:hypothetical protein